jgi:Uma2 family endonuclease
MATETQMAVLNAMPTREADGDQCVAFPAVGWKGYVTLLRLRGERPRPRMVYLDGTVWLMTTSFPHERLKKRLGWVVEEIVRAFRIPCIATASTTFRRRSKKGGVEGDETYYIANESRIRDKEKIRLRTDPPPDLAIEAVVSHDADGSIEVYRRLRVREVWVCDESQLIILVLQPDGQYAQSPTSAAFPFLSAAEIFDWVGRPQTMSDTEWMNAVHRWVGRTLKPRVRRQRQNPGGD